MQLIIVWFLKGFYFFDMLMKQANGWILAFPFGFTLKFLVKLKVSTGIPIAISLASLHSEHLVTLSILNNISLCFGALDKSYVHCLLSFLEPSSFFLHMFNIAYILHQFIQYFIQLFCFQYYVYLGGQSYVDLGLGTHRVKCRVHEDFK